jgi:hypothetical protein
MLHIDRMRMRLPKGFEHRASSIARLVGDSMADMRTTESRTLDKLSIGPLQIGPNATDQDIANGIVERIVERITLLTGRAP